MSRGVRIQAARVVREHASPELVQAVGRGLVGERDPGLRGRVSIHNTRSTVRPWCLGPPRRRAHRPLNASALHRRR